jgi:hypothetical protein
VRNGRPDEDPAQDSRDSAPSEGQLLNDEDDLQAALLGLSRLVAGSDPLEALLTQVAEFAVRAIPGADGAGVTMHNDGRSSMVTASGPVRRRCRRYSVRPRRGTLHQCCRATAHCQVWFARRREAVAPRYQPITVTVVE